MILEFTQMRFSHWQCSVALLKVDADDKKGYAKAYMQQKLYTILFTSGVGKHFRLLGHFGESRRRTRPEKTRFLLLLCAEDKMIKCNKHSEKKWNGLNPVIPKAEEHFEKDACF